jgi:NIPSNAP
VTVAEFEERFAKRLPLREKHSKLGAFWHTEFGPLNQVIHVLAQAKPSTVR